jgi:hypothetical protein
MKESTKLYVAALLAASAGVVATLIVSVANPLGSSVRPAAPISSVSVDGLVLETFHMDAPRDGIAATNNGDKPIPPYPAGVGILSEQHISQGFILLTKLRNKDGTVIGFTSEQEVVRDESNVMQGRLMTITTWTLTIPGRGTIFLAEDENQSEFAKRVAIPALALGKPWNEPWTFVTTVGPEADGRGKVVGGTGEFAGITGSFVEVTHLRRFSEKEFVGTIELQLAYRKPTKLSMHRD